MALSIINGSIFDSKELFIVHQCNIVSTKPTSLAKAIFELYPYANIYATRADNKYRDVPGAISVAGNGYDKRFIINLFGQLYPGIPLYPNSGKDSFEMRLQYFKSGLSLISQLPLVQDSSNKLYDNFIAGIAFPFGIGCSAAGGNWNIYLQALKNFSEEINIPVVIYKL